VAGQKRVTPRVQEARVIGLSLARGPAAINAGLASRACVGDNDDSRLS